MFDYTRDYYELLKRDFKRIDIAFSIISIIATIVYPIFAICVDLGNLYINIAILSLASLYTIFRLIFGKKKFKMDRIYVWLRIIISTVSLVINIYTIYIGTTNVNGTAIIIAAIMTIFWILKVLLNLLYDIVMPRVETLILCVKEDTKPYVRNIDKITTLVNKKPIFGYGDDETPEAVLNVARKSNKASKKLKKSKINDEIKKEYLRILEQADLNNDGNIDVSELIKMGLSLDGVLLSKSRFMHQEFASKMSKEQIDKYIKSGPSSVKLDYDDLSNLSYKMILENESAIEVVKSYINEDGFDFKNEKDFRKLLKSFALTLITMQKVIYLYGVKQIDDPLKLDDYHLSSLILAFSIVLRDENEQEAKEELYKLNYSNLKDKVLQFAASKIGFIKDHQEQIKDGIMKAIPVVDKILGMYSKGKLGKVLSAANIALKLIKK